MKYRLIVTNNFDKRMRRLSKEHREKARVALKKIQGSPYENKELGGRLKGLRRARFGDCRIIYAIDEKRKAIVLISIGPRERVYEH